MISKLSWDMFRWDANNDMAFTISDVLELAIWLACWPGNALIGFISKYMRPVATFLEIDSTSFYAWPAWVISIVGWFFIAALISTLRNPS